MEVKDNHPLAEIIAKALFGIETVPAEEQRRMVNRACKAAVWWYKTNTDDTSQPAVEACTCKPGNERYSMECRENCPVHGG